MPEPHSLVERQPARSDLTQWSSTQTSPWLQLASEMHAVHLLSIQARAKPQGAPSKQGGDVADRCDQQAEEAPKPVRGSVLWQLRLAVPERVHVTVLADGGFADTGLFWTLKEKMRFDYVIRFKRAPSSSLQMATRDRLANGCHPTVSRSA